MLLQLVLGIIPSISRGKKSGWTTLREEILAELAENFKIGGHLNWRNVEKIDFGGINFGDYLYHTKIPS